MRIRAISFDLDDTLWPIAPVMQRAEEHLHQWLLKHCPAVAQAFPLTALRELREQVAKQHPQLAHDFSALRKITLRTAFSPFGFDESWVERAFEEFHSARNEVECYDDVLPALQRIAELVPVISISNGTADLARIGISGYFHFHISARECGVAKPDAAIFRNACERLALHPSSVLHVGDDPKLDIEGARSAGMQTAWINRSSAMWQAEQLPDLTISDLGALRVWLEQHLLTEN